MLNEAIWGSRIALVVIDPQRKFTLGIPDWESRMRSAVEGINAFARVFRENGAPVIFIRYEGASHTGYDASDADSWLEGIETASTDIVVRKTNMNCFKDTELESVLKENGIDCAVFAGMLTELCVVSTYFAASERDVFPYLGKGATIAYNANGNEAAEVICNMVDLPTAERFLKGEQLAFEPEI